MQFPYLERVSYFTDEELKNYHCSVSITPSGECLLMQQESPLKDGTYLIVLDSNNHLYAAQETEQEIEGITYMIKHSSLSQGKSVRYAGEAIVQDGIVKVLNSKSGHYYPGKAEVQRMLSFLNGHKVLLSTIEWSPIPAKC